MNKLSLELDKYSEEEIKAYALKYLHSKNSAIDYYNSEKGKERYRAGSRKYYHNNREKCLKHVQPRRGRPRKNPIEE